MTESRETHRAPTAGAGEAADPVWQTVDRIAFWLLVAALIWVVVSPGLASLAGLGEWFLRADLLFGWVAFALVFVRARTASSAPRTSSPGATPAWSAARAT